MLLNRMIWSVRAGKRDLCGIVISVVFSKVGSKDSAGDGAESCGAAQGQYDQLTSDLIESKLQCITAHLKNLYSHLGARSVPDPGPIHPFQLPTAWLTPQISSQNQSDPSPLLPLFLLYLPTSLPIPFSCSVICIRIRRTNDGRE